MTKKVYGIPTPELAARQDNSGIHQLVLNLARELPKFGYELVNSPDNADLIAHHAGSAISSDVAFYHGIYPTQMQPFDKTFHEINERVLKDCLIAKAVIAPSQWTADILRRDLHIQPRVVSWGVNLKDWKHDYEYERYVLWNKARDTDVCFTEWLDRLSEASPGTNFVTTFGKERANVKVMGRTDHATMREVIKRAGIYLATTKETGDIGSREALAAGVPVLGFAHGALPEFVIHGYNGFLAAPGDFDGLLAGLAYCQRNRDALSKNALQSAKAFGWHHTAKRIAGIFDGVLKASPPKYKVAIIIPCYNYADYVAQAIESALAQQTALPYQVIVVNDGSTDNSLEVIRQFADRVTLIDKPNGGVATARNMGIAQADAAYIICLDADDMLKPDFLQTCADALDRNPLAGIAYTRLEVLDHGVSGWLAGQFDYTAQTKQQNQIPTCNVFRKEAWQRAGGYRQNKFPAEDADLWLRITSLGYTAIKASEQALFLYRAHDRSATAALRGGLGIEPNWVIGKGWIESNQFPALAGGKVHPVRNYDQPDVSIIIPVGAGHEQLLHDALDSVEGQSHPFWEVIVINDTGHDLDLTAYPYVREYISGGRVGAPKARNIGIQHASGKFIVFLDADDYLHPDYLARTLRAYKQSGQYIYTDWTMHTKQGTVETHECPEFYPERIFVDGFYHAITALVPTAWIKEVGGFDETMGAWEDWDLYMRLQIKGYCGKRLATPLFGYRYTTGTIRESGEAQQGDLKALLYKRYSNYMDKKEVTVCNCAKLKQPAFDDIGEQELIRIRYTSEMQGKHTVWGVAQANGKKHNYGRRSGGDIFFVFPVDYAAMRHVFEAVPEVTDEAPVTEIPADLQLA